MIYEDQLEKIEDTRVRAMQLASIKVAIPFNLFNEFCELSSTVTKVAKPLIKYHYICEGINGKKSNFNFILDYAKINILAEAKSFFAPCLSYNDLRNIFVIECISDIELVKSKIYPYDDKGIYLYILGTFTRYIEIAKERFDDQKFSLTSFENQIHNILLTHIPVDERIKEINSKKEKYNDDKMFRILLNDMIVKWDDIYDERDKVNKLTDKLFEALGEKNV